MAGPHWALIWLMWAVPWCGLFTESPQWAQSHRPRLGKPALGLFKATEARKKPAWVPQVHVCRVNRRKTNIYSDRQIIKDLNRKICLRLSCSELVNPYQNGTILATLGSWGFWVCTTIVEGQCASGFVCLAIFHRQCILRHWKIVYSALN